MQAKNSKLKKQIRDKIDRIDLMNLKLEEVARENKQSADIIEIYSTLLGVHVEKLPDDDKGFLLYCLDKPGGKARVVEAKMESRPKQVGRAAADEWIVTVLKLPLNPYQGLSVGQKLCYTDHTLPDFFNVIKEAGNMHN